MDSALLAGLSAASPTTVLLFRATLPDHEIRLTDGGFVVWAGDLFDGRDEVYGTLGSVEEIEDGADGQATRCAITVLPPSAVAMAQLASPLVQGAPITVHLGAVDRQTGLMIGVPDLLFRGELDYGRLGVGDSWSLVLECGTEEARQLELNADQRLSDSYHKAIWTGERGLENVTAVKRKIHWQYKR